MMSTLSELRSALRWIARRPGLASVSVASLGLAVGANVAVFSVIDALLFRPFPVSEPERLGVVMSRTAEGELRHVSAPDYFDFVESSSDRFTLAARMQFILSVRVGDVTERLEAEFVSSSYFDVFGVPPTFGRSFSANERVAPVPSVVISRRLWRTRFEEAPKPRSWNVAKTKAGRCAPGRGAHALAKAGALCVRRAQRPDERHHSTDKNVSTPPAKD